MQSKEDYFLQFLQRKNTKKLWVFIGRFGVSKGCVEKQVFYQLIYVQHMKFKVVIVAVESSLDILHQDHQ